ncbi:alpha-ketoacid dehydrogenase subunit beta [Varunaivibrio sulfuroxidans]|uniref:Pyruvate dehydrogenase E1 component beta subunit n=1 Tax=Varunaivibrio sulfuroxidans TaxID=1773489 RepID=A0A4R3JHI7_9PROT|nr:transketolase C-terminal domain-containing protein [Varunaivibrio sulfuroxidans]TCS64726.1 pyruvate dehydrogenase E1 component beta subunit [Varunaivibrio sulfuroxidans]WES29969.1 transketolase C-terminal domain-containing protein [Varunaivibrio sulfuroxidans]
MPEAPSHEITFAQAVREGFEQAMEQDQNVIVIGEGVPDPKAIFTTTSGLREKFGHRRVFDMPLSENGLTGVCIGAALQGIRPVLVHQRIDFALLSMDQLVNNAAKWHYMFDGKASVPLVVRMIVGRGWGQGPQHSQSLQSMFAQVPGMKVVMPTTGYDAKGMLIAAIKDDNPVLIIEHRWLHQIKDVVPLGPYDAPLHKAKVLHEGSDVTVAAFSYMTVEALVAAKALLSTMGVSIEVIDMRSVRPLDTETVLSSVKKTGRLIVADTAFRTGSIAGEVIAQIVEKGFNALKAKPVRIASPDFPAPTSQYMSEHYYPDARTIAEAVIDLVEGPRSTGGYAQLKIDIHPRGRHDTPNQEFTGPF